MRMAGSGHGVTDTLDRCAHWGLERHSCAQVPSGGEVAQSLWPYSGTPRGMPWPAWQVPTSRPGCSVSTVNRQRGFSTTRQERPLVPPGRPVTLTSVRMAVSSAQVPQRCYCPQESPSAQADGAQHEAEGSIQVPASAPCLHRWGPPGGLSFPAVHWEQWYGLGCPLKGQWGAQQGQW